MKNSLLFLPDISGFTEFIQTTEVEHSQHVIAELLEIFISANTQNMKLAEVEGDALFFYKEGDILSQEKLLAQMETMFTAFYSHLKVLEKNRICPCNACATAPNLQLKIIAHAGALQFIEVQRNRKPFGQEVIEAHRLMKNSVQSDNYVLVSKRLANEIGLNDSYQSKLFDFDKGVDVYDKKEVEYLFSVVDNSVLKLRTFSDPYTKEFKSKPDIYLKEEMPIEAEDFLEIITNYRYRSYWVKGVDAFEFNENEVTRVGSEHVCVIDGKHLDFVTVTKAVDSGKLIYGEVTKSPKPVDALYQFFILSPLPAGKCLLESEVYMEAQSFFKKLLISLVIRRVLAKNIKKSILDLK
ncbi:MAG: DUF2652 domain-containing protein, partial [Flavobacteriales bacterium]|nr:DUF2652 domain-containing protein [Flavobacteriales bacterium]